MHLIEAKFRGQLIDPDTGEFEEFLFNGTGRIMATRPYTKRSQVVINSSWPLIST